VAILIAAVTGVTLAIVYRSRDDQNSLSRAELDQLERRAWDALIAGETNHAKSLANEVLDHDPNSKPALLCAGQAAARLERYNEAIKYFLRFPNDGSDGSKTALCLAANELLYRNGEVTRAETLLQIVLKHDPQHALANEILSRVYLLLGRRRKATPQLLQAIAGGRANLENVSRLGWVAARFEDKSLLEKCRAVEPQNSYVLFGLARLAEFESEDARALQLTQTALPGAGNDVELQALRGLLLLEHDPGEFPAWHAALPDDADESPDIWFVRGMWLKGEQEYEAAARCLWECVRRLPDHRAATYQLGQLLAKLQTPTDAEPFQTRAVLLERLGVAYSRIDSMPDDPLITLHAAEIAERLGRIREAHALYEISFAKNANLRSAHDAAQRLTPRLKTAELARTEPGKNPALQIDLSHLPLPKSMKFSASRSKLDPVNLTAAGAIQFRDVALAAGLDFRYFIRDEPKREGIRIIETLGGGVAVLDYDNDSWPDLYFTQGREYPPKPGQGMHTDRLFRNLGNGRFVDVTATSGLGDRNCTHSAAVGDYNSDGWPDLYLANLGRNRLYRNNGDGTFADVSDEAGLSTEMWTAACLMADLNGDGHPDIYDVNYLHGTRPLEQLCEIDGHIRSCDPAFFTGGFDQLLLNLGSGPMQNVTTTSGIDVSGGKGLGIVAANLDGSGRLSLFIANDGVSNFFFLNQSTKPGRPEMQLFRETALASGLAYNRDGKGQACMGVAFGDADGDGRFDLFVTNFHRESNSLYTQVSDTLFDDRTRQAGLRAPSYSMTGWGTQFLDADLDGWPDLIIANGHVDDFSFQASPFRMRPQFLRNVGHGRFQELYGKTLGPYFQRKLLGRGLAKIDWNRDGKEDCVVLHLFDSTALLSNVTQTKHHWFTLKLRGTTSSRDAIGTVVTFFIGERKIVKQLTAGDGYSASNERHLLLGLATSPKIDKLEVRWPSGTVQVFRNVPGDQAVLLVEGRDRLMTIPK
jgi:tetratricopeptide (TPR) repeat protein